MLCRISSHSFLTSILSSSQTSPPTPTMSGVPSSTRSSAISSPTGNATVTKNPQSGLSTLSKGLLGGIVAPLGTIMVVLVVIFVWKFTMDCWNVRENMLLNQHPTKLSTRAQSPDPPPEAVEFLNRLWASRRRTSAPQPLEAHRENVELAYQRRERDREAQGQDPFHHNFNDSYFHNSGNTSQQHQRHPRPPAYSNSIHSERNLTDPPTLPIPRRSPRSNLLCPPPRPPRPESLSQSVIDVMASPTQGSDLVDGVLANGIPFESVYDDTQNKSWKKTVEHNPLFDEPMLNGNGPDRDDAMSPEPLRIVKQSASDTTPYVTSREDGGEAAMMLETSTVELADSSIKPEIYSIRKMPWIK
jgi:hypothetical protein